MQAFELEVEKTWKAFPKTEELSLTLKLTSYAERVKAISYKFFPKKKSRKILHISCVSSSNKHIMLVFMCSTRSTH